MSATKNVLVSHELAQDNITIISINRSRVFNCVDGPTARELEAAFIAFENDPKAKVAILRGEGGNFCSGADLAAIQGDATRSNPMNTNLDEIGPMGISRLCLSKPVLACIEGYCLAGGFELACWCSMRIVSETAQIGIKCRERGVPLIDGGSVRLPELIGLSRAADLILTGRTISASEAHNFGWANRVFPKEQVFDETVKLAKLLAGHPQICMRNDWISARGATARTTSDYNVQGETKRRMEIEFQLGLKSLTDPEMRNRLEKFLNKKGAGKL